LQNVSFIKLRSSESLWQEAVKSLSVEDRQYIKVSRPEKIDILSDLLSAAEKKRQLCLDKRWRFSRNGEQIILRDLCEKIVVWVNKFKEIGDVAAQCDPCHASLPWAALRLILQASRKGFTEVSEQLTSLRCLSMTRRRSSPWQKAWSMFPV
jgi:hypothetical protein